MFKQFSRSRLSNI